MATVALVTAVYGGYDVPYTLPPDHGFDDAVLVSDRPVQARGWRVVVQPSDEHPRLAAKEPKCRPWRHTRCDASVWLDGSLRLKAPMRPMIDGVVAHAEQSVSLHPDAGWRTDVFAEAEHSASMPKYAGQPMAEQVDHYRGRGLPPGSGLFACGFIARRHTDDVRLFGEMWLHEIRRWSTQDQLSFPWVAWRLSMPPNVLDLANLRNEYWEYHHHMSEL